MESRYWIVLCSGFWPFSYLFSSILSMLGARSYKVILVSLELWFIYRTCKINTTQGCSARWVQSCGSDWWLWFEPIVIMPEHIVRVEACFGKCKHKHWIMNLVWIRMVVVGGGVVGFSKFASFQLKDIFQTTKPLPRLNRNWIQEEKLENPVEVLSYNVLHILQSNGHIVLNHPSQYIQEGFGSRESVSVALVRNDRLNAWVSQKHSWYIARILAVVSCSVYGCSFYNWFCTSSHRLSFKNLCSVAQIGYLKMNDIDKSY